MEQTMRFVLAAQPATTLDDRFVRLITGEPHPLGNMAFLNDTTDAASASDAIGPLVSSGHPSAVLGCSSPSEGVHNLLIENGYVSEGPMPEMAIAIESISKTNIPQGYEFVRILDQASSEAWTQALAQGYGLPVPLAALFAPHAFGGTDPAPDASVQWFGIAKGDTIVAVSMLNVMDGLAGIYCVATLEEERGKGLGAHVTAEPLRLAARAGIQTGILQSSEMGYPVYERIGFNRVGEMPLYIRMPQGD